MNLSQYVRCLKDMWLLVVLTTVVGVLLGTAAGLMMPKSYESQAQVFVNVANPRSVTDLQMGEQFAVARAASYARVATTNSVLQPVVDTVHLDETPEELAESGVVATNQPNTAMITLTATGTSAQQAADIAQATADSLVEVSRSLETIPQAQDGQQPANVKLNVVQKAAVPQKSSGPSAAVNAALGALVGLIAGLLLVLLRGGRSLRARERAGAEHRATRRARAAVDDSHEH
ncbi:MULTISPECIES: YveK family protein [Kocuria]|uniref:YveK family protein n=1 Tax=Kocuria TaxID=57493 RepID=UPI0009F9FE04|nr:MULTISPECIES: Wzz/FepE/Etk N-terminal domain-containing protein [Kocuria]MDN5630541.1 Wzz/FepE/Etk N-terminal domain-containing protein [Kocuria sp.]